MPGRGVKGKRSSFGFFRGGGCLTNVKNGADTQVLLVGNLLICPACRKPQGLDSAALLIWHPFTLLGLHYPILLGK